LSIVATEVRPDGIRLAADSQITLGMSADTRDKYAKIVVSPLGFVAGCVGYAETASLLALYTETRIPQNATELDIFRFMNEFNQWAEEHGAEGPLTHSGFHILWGGRAFEMIGHSVRAIESWAAIGSGADYAQTAFHLGKDAITAAFIACDLNIFCGPPVTVVDCSIQGDNDDAEIRIDISEHSVLPQEV